MSSHHSNKLDLKTWTKNILDSSASSSSKKRHLLPTEFIEFPADGEVAKYFLDDNVSSLPLPQDPRVNPFMMMMNNNSDDDDFFTTVKKNFEDDTIMERQSGWDDKVKTAFPSSSSNVKEENNETKQQQQQKLSVDDFKKLIDEIEIAIKKIESYKMVGEGVCLVGAFCSIDDAGWALASNTPSCASVRDVFTTLTTSTKFVRDLKKQQSLHQQRTTTATHNDDCDFLFYFGIRPFLEVNAASEFRVFVSGGENTNNNDKGNKVLGICQRHMDQLFPHLFPFAIPIGSDDDDDHRGDDDEEKQQTELALKWSHQIETIITENFFSTSSSSSSCHINQKSFPMTIIDIIHPGPDQLHLPLHILGVQQFDEQELLDCAEDENVFRIFGTYDQLKDFDRVVKKFLAEQQKVFGDDNKNENENENENNKNSKPSTIVRIATCAEDLFKDSRAAHRGGAPLEFTEKEYYDEAVEAIRKQNQNATSASANANATASTSERPGDQIIQEIVTTRTHVHGTEKM